MQLIWLLLLQWPSLPSQIWICKGSGCVLSFISSRLVDKVPMLFFFLFTGNVQNSKFPSDRCVSTYVNTSRVRSVDSFLIGDRQTDYAIHMYNLTSSKRGQPYEFRGRNVVFDSWHCNVVLHWNIFILSFRLFSIDLEDTSAI